LPLEWRVTRPVACAREWVLDVLLMSDTVPVCSIFMLI
jgi:hypothetical protein